MEFFTADICDAYFDKVSVLGANFKSYGGAQKCQGEVITVKLDKNNKDLAKLLKEQKGEGKVVVVDVEEGYYAVVGDNLMKFAFENKYSGIIVNGYVRDIETVKNFDLALFAKGVCPRKYIQEQNAIIGCDITIDGIIIQNKNYLYADSDGIIVLKEKIS